MTCLLKEDVIWFFEVFMVVMMDATCRFLIGCSAWWNGVGLLKDRACWFPAYISMDFLYLLGIKILCKPLIRTFSLFVFLASISSSVASVSFSLATSMSLSFSDSSFPSPFRFGQFFHIFTLGREGFRSASLPVLP